MMQRRGFLGKLGLLGAGALVPITATTAVKSKGDGPWFFVSKYRGLRVQAAPHKAAQFKDGVFVTSDSDLAEAVRRAAKDNRVWETPYVWEKVV